MLVLGSDVWLGGAETAARHCAEALRLPVIANGQARGVLPGGHSLLVSRARSLAFAEADLVIVVGVPLDFRLRYGSFGPKDAPASVVHVADSPGGIATHCPLAASASGDLSLFFTALTDACGAPPGGRHGVAGATAGNGPGRHRGGRPAAGERGRLRSTRCASTANCCKVLDDDAVVIGDGGDFVSFAGRLIEPAFPGRWLDPGPYGCLGTGLGYAMAARLAHPSSQVVLMLGDGAAGLSLMDVDTLVRHNLPGGHDRRQQLGLGPGEGPDAGRLRLRRGGRPAPGTRYDEVVRALGGAGRTGDRAGRNRGRRCDAPSTASVPYLINVITDVDAEYPGLHRRIGEAGRGEEIRRALRSGDRVLSARRRGAPDLRQAPPHPHARPQPPHNPGFDFRSRN